MIRPIVEYADVIYNNCTLSIDRTIEGIQRRAALICTGAYKHTEHAKLLTDLGWATLKPRRKFHCMCLYYKIIKGKCPNYVTKLLPKQANNLTNYNLRTQNNLRLPLMKLKSYKTSFIPFATELWNKLPLTTRQSSSLNIFKKLINPKSLSSNYNQLYSGYYGR